MNLEEYLSKFTIVTRNPNLDAMKYFMEEFHHPEKKTKFIHIAGTNGKGSVCEMVNNILVNAGFTVGKYISPHLIKYNERISVNNKEITDQEISDLLDVISKKIDEYSKEHDTKIKEFEVITLIALLYFANKKCDFVVLETGLGGTYDCTNIADGMVSIITDIGYDHMDILGNTIEKIANNKAGIIKKDADTVMYFQDKVTNIIKEKCLKENNTLHLVDLNEIKNYSYDKKFQKIDYKSHKDVLINLKGRCQTYNASLALETIDILRDKGYAINEEAVKKGLSTVIHRARFETLSENPEIIFDGGHNENAIKNLKKMIEQYYKNDKKTYIISVLKSKDYKTLIKLLTEDKDANFIFTSGNSETRYVPKEELYNEAKKYLDKNIYMCNLNEAVENAKNGKYQRVTFIIR